ncbi:MAG: protein-disulfide reductase DsbD domain-containing protein [Acidobacteriota bacterium]
MKFLPALALLAACPCALRAQTSQLLAAAPPQKIAAKRGEATEARIKLQLRNGYHVNSNAPNEDYLIPLRLKWEPGPLAAAEVVYPKAEQKNYSFSSKPVAVFTGQFEVLTKFKVDAAAPAGPGVLVGKLRYQACSEDTCYRPATLEIRLPYEVH